jgi:lipopolysaccharide transport protein LptA
MKSIHFSIALARKSATIAILFIFTFSILSQVTAQPTEDTDEFGFGTGQIRITSDQLIADSKENSAEFIGNVHAIQEDTIITSDHMKVYFKKGATENNKEPAPDTLVKLVITGNVEIKFDDRVAQTQKAVYIAEKKRMVLTGPNTKIISGKDTVIGEKITYFRDHGRIEVEASQGNRVEAVIYPEEKK